MLLADPRMDSRSEAGDQGTMLLVGHGIGTLLLADSRIILGKYGKTDPRIILKKVVQGL